MDIDTITEFRPAPGTAWQPGDAWLAGGTWLFSQPQPGLRRLLDLRGFGWDPLTERPGGLEIAATCTLAELARWRPAGVHEPRPRAWPAVPLLRHCCDALLASFKVQNMATVGGNIALALPAGAMTSLAASLDGTATIWSPGGGPRGTGHRGRHRPREHRAGPGRAAPLGHPAGHVAAQPDRVPAGVALPDGAVRGPGHRPHPHGAPAWSSP